MKHFFRFLKTKMLHKSWMMAALLVGNVLLIAICSSCPMYITAAQQKSLDRAFTTYVEDTGTYPGAVSIDANSRKYFEDDSRALLYADGDALAASLPTMIENTPQAAVTTYTMQQYAVCRIHDARAFAVTLSHKNNLEQHIKLTEGTYFTDEDDVISVLVSDRTLMGLSLQVGDTFSLDKIQNADGTPVIFRITGAFIIGDASDPYWDVSPSTLVNYFFISEQSFDTYYRMNERYNVQISWRTVLDQEQLSLAKLQTVADVIKGKLENDERFTGYTLGFESMLDTVAKETAKVTLTLWVLQILTMLLLLAFLFMVSSQLIRMEQNEISVYKSRGASGMQIFTIYLLQSGILAALGLMIGIPLGIFFCQTIGSANEFLEFVGRKALTIRLTATVWLFAFGSAILSMAVTLVPVIKQSRIDIVQAKRAKQGKKQKPLWARLFLDLILIAVSIYTWYFNHGRTDELAAELAAGKNIDPLLYLAAPMFMVGIALLVLRIFPYLIKGVFKLFEKLWNPALYASFLQIMRSAGNRGFLMVFLMLTVASGVYYSTAANSINTNATERLYYQSGADIVLQERWLSEYSATVSVGGVGDVQRLGYIEPDFGKYYTLESNTPEIVSMTKVYQQTGLTAAYDLTNEVQNVMLLGIHTKEFGQTANMNENLLPTHFYNYLNAMSQNLTAVLVSTNFHDDYGVELGDSISYHTTTGARRVGVIAGFVDYFPTYQPTVKTAEGVMDQYLIVANFAYLEQLSKEYLGIPYQVWMKVDKSSKFIYDFAEENNLKFAEFSDLSQDTVALKNEPLLQGTNGVLTLGFIVTLLLCAVGFLMYWILSIGERQLQFGIFRAMGMSSGEVMLMLGCEQFCVSGLSVVMGYLIGLFASKLFVPLIQIAYSSADQVLPMQVITSGTDILRLLVIIGIVMVLCLSVITVMIRRMKIAQALKLGED